MLRVDKVSLSFRGVRALDGVDLSVDDHEIVGIIGPNGSGKSTLFNVISGVYRADGGDVFFDGKSIKGLGPTELGRAFAHCLGSLITNLAAALLGERRKDRMCSVALIHDDQLARHLVALQHRFDAFPQQLRSIA